MKTFEELNKKLLSQSFSVGIVGLGYVGIPLALAYLRENIVVRGVDIDEEKIETLLAGGCYIDTVDKETVRSAIDAQQFIVSTSFSLLAEADVVCICVPTPVNKKDDPDLQFVISAAQIKVA